MAAGKTTDKSKRAKILVVDSDKNTVRSYKEFFSQQTGYRIVTVSSGRQALAKMKTGHFDLVILDVMMPGMSGIDVCGAMSKHARLKKIPVILASALPVESSSFWKTVRNNDEFAVVKETVEKPIETDKLLAKIKRVVATSNF
jgi:CheY-like chemotaxis protein